MIEELNISSKERIPVIGHFEITRKCTYRCQFCYNHIDNTKEELKTEEILSLITNFADMGCIHINVSGGEPFIHPDFNIIYSHLIQAGIHVSIETNLSFLPNETVELLTKFPPVIILVSMYAVSEETQKNVTKSNISIETVKNNVFKLKNNNIKFQLRTPVTIDNYKELHLLNEFSKDIESDFSFDAKIWWNQNGVRKHYLRCKSQMVENYKGLHPIYEELYNRLKIMEDMPYTIKKCNWGDNEFYVNPYGEIHYCIVFWSNKYNLLKGSFFDAWNKWYKKYRKSSSMDCIGRKLFPTKGACPSGYLYYNSSIDTGRKIEEILITNIKNDIAKGNLLSDILENYQLNEYFENSCNNLEDIEKYFTHKN